MYIIASLFTSTAYHLSCDHFTLGSFILPLMSTWVVSSFVVVVFFFFCAMMDCDNYNVLVYISFYTCSKVPFEYTLRVKLLSYMICNYSVYVCVSCSVMFDPLRPRGLQPTRLTRPWNSPGKNTGVGCHFLLHRIFPTQELNLGLLHYRQFFTI